MKIYYYRLLCLLFIIITAFSGCKSSALSKKNINSDNSPIDYVKNERVNLQDTFIEYFSFIDETVSSIVFNQKKYRNSRDFGVDIMEKMRYFLKKKDTYKSKLSRSKFVLEKIPRNNSIEESKNVLVDGIDGIIKSINTTEEAMVDFHKGMTDTQDTSKRKLAGRAFFNGLNNAKKEKDVARSKIERSDNSFYSITFDWPSLSDSY